MPPPLVRVALPLIIGAALPVAAMQQPEAALPLFKAGAELVVLHVNVFDGRSDTVPDLPQHVFHVLEDDVPQAITFFNSTDVPVAVGLVVDNSGSMIARRKMVVAGGRAFVESSHPDDELFAVVFNEHVQLGLPESVPSSSDAIVYTIASRDFGADRGNPSVLKKLAELTGGVAYFPDAEREVVGNLQEIADNIRRGYSIGYVPPATGKEGRYRRVKVTVRVPGRKNLSVRTRHGYAASDHVGTR